MAWGGVGINLGVVVVAGKRHGSGVAEDERWMRRALEEIQVEGIATTAPFHNQLLQHPTFVRAGHDTKFVERELMG